MKFGEVLIEVIQEDGTTVQGEMVGNAFQSLNSNCKKECMLFWEQPRDLIKNFKFLISIIFQIPVHLWRWRRVLNLIQSVWTSEESLNVNWFAEGTELTPQHEPIIKCFFHFSIYEVPFSSTVYVQWRNDVGGVCWMFSCMDMIFRLADKCLLINRIKAFECFLDTFFT